MRKEKDPLIKTRHNPRGPFLQPLALGLVCLIFVTLVLTMGLMDFRTLDKTLLGYMEKRGISFIRTVQKTATFNLQQINHPSGEDFFGTSPIGLGDQPFSIQESMVMELLQLAQRIDHERRMGELNNEELISLASKEGLSNTVFLNTQGRVTFQKRTVPKPVLKSISAMMRKGENLNVHLFNPLGKHKPARFLALRRKNGKGFLVLVLDHESFFFWKLRTALEMAIGSVGLPSNTDCFSIEDKAGRVLFQTGRCPDLYDETDNTSALFEKGKSISSERVVSKGEKRLLMIAKLSFGEEASGVARLRLKTDALDQMIGKERRWGIAAMGFMVFIAILSMWFLYRNQNRHITKMQQMQQQLHQAERLSAMGRLAAGVAHEIRNPLNAISMACQRLKNDNLEELSKVIRIEISRLNGIIEEFLGFSRGRQLKLVNTDLVDLVRQVVSIMEEEARSKSVAFQTTVTESSLMMLLDANKIKQALINILKNAMESISGSGTVTIGIRLEEKKIATLTVSDTGVGLAEGDEDKIFNPDFTTKEQGLGLGLALAHEIVQAHGGEIRVRSVSDVGTTFDISLPIKGA